MLIYLNGEFLPLERARISPLDRGFLFGDGVYEVIPVYEGQAFLLKEHLARLSRSLAAVDIKNPLTATQWTEIIFTLSADLGTAAHGIYLAITRGAGTTRQHQYSADLQPTCFAMSINIRLLSDQEKNTGLAAITAADQRWKRCDIKSLNLLPNVLAVQQGFLQGASETILIAEGYVTEGSSSNVFIVKDQIIYTPPKSSGILSGITRDFVLELARAQQLNCKEEPISVAQLETADELWITSSGRELVPITQLNHQPVGSGQVGPLWQQLQAHFQTQKEILHA